MQEGTLESIPGTGLVTLRAEFKKREKKIKKKEKNSTKYTCK